MARKDANIDIWSKELREEYVTFIRSKKELSKASIHSYCWRLETLFKALTAGTPHQGSILCKDTIRKLVEEKREEAERLVRQDDRQSHYRMLKEFLGIPELPPSFFPSTASVTSTGSGVSLLLGQDSSGALLQSKPPGTMDFGAASVVDKNWGVRGKVWDAELKRDYTNWLKEKGVKERTCGSYCTYVHNMLRALADRRPEGSLNADGSLRRREGLNKADVKELLVEESEEAARLVKQSKKSRYLRSFKEFLGMRIEGKPPKAPLTWIDRMCIEYKCWLEKEGDERVAVIRSKAYVGASRAILRSFKKNNWMGENRIETATREELRTCLSEHTKDLQMELGEKADDDRLGKLLAWLETPPMPPDTFNDYLDSDEEEDGGAEDGSEQGNTGGYNKRKRENNNAGGEDLHAKVARLEAEGAQQKAENSRLRDHIKTIRDIYTNVVHSIQNGVAIPLPMLPDIPLDLDLTSLGPQPPAAAMIHHHQQQPPPPPPQHPQPLPEPPHMHSHGIPASALLPQVDPVGQVVQMPMGVVNSTAPPTLVDLPEGVSVSMVHTHTHEVPVSLDLIPHAMVAVMTQHDDPTHLLGHDDVHHHHVNIHHHHDPNQHHHHHHHHMDDTHQDHHQHHHHHHHHEHEHHQHMEVDDHALEHTVLEEVAAHTAHL